MSNFWKGFWEIWGSNTAGGAFGALNIYFSGQQAGHGEWGWAAISLVLGLGLLAVNFYEELSDG